MTRWKKTDWETMNRFLGFSFNHLAVMMGLVFVAMLSLLSLDDVSAVPGTLTISIPDTISLDVLPSASGTFASTSSNITVRTTYAHGYTLGIAAKTANSNALINTNDSSKTIPSITSSVSESDFSSSTSYNNKWGYSPSKYNSAANTNYLVAPTSTTMATLDKTSAANSTDNTYTIKLGARIDATLTPGTYENTFVFTVTPNATPYTINYNKNTTDTVTNMPTPNPQTGETFATTVNISNTVPARDGYLFKGWCTVAVADGATCSGTTYNPDGGGTSLSWTIDQTAVTNTLNLYAMWAVADPCIGELYCKVAAMSKGTQTEAQLRAAITVPTSADRTQDTSNSGVYEYNSSVFGTSSDASNTSKIYYYRGVLENSVGSYGSDGSAVTYPNYVKLGNTCWRIVRTTGSGGVKMIYNGTYGATTSGSCANTEANAQVTTSAFNGTSSTYRQIVRVGYTYNSTYATNTSKSGTIAQIFGSNSDPSINDTRSTIKEYIEDTWYASNMTAYTSKLEASAGYCNDRTMNTTDSWTTPLAESTTIASTYGTSGQQAYYFGAYPRNETTNQPPSLTCGNKYSQIDRSTVDLYRYVPDSNGTSNQLKYPAALLTADEAAFAGSGYSSSTTPNHANSFLRSGSNFWLLSPDYRISIGYTYGFYLFSNRNLSNSSVDYAFGVRPVISLTSGTSAASGSGTATDPWIVNPAPTLYDEVATAWEDEGSRVMTNDTDTDTGIQAAITTSNSGVFKYNPSTFGTSSDASNDHDIYFYRGILDNTTGSYGSDGDNAAHPNTVVLSTADNKSGLTTTDTCWRIVRTTGSGGVKMVYQGTWTGSCANTKTNAQVATSAFNGTSSTYKQIVRVGYTYNSTYATNTSKSGTIAQIFGSNSNPGANNTRSTIKEYIEDTWYSSAIGANSGHNFTSKLEASAGYCNDRTMNTTPSWTSPLAESTTIASTYGTSSQQAYYFGARPRNAQTAQPPSLTCGNKYSQIDRSTVDLYRYVSGSTGVSNQLKYPAALITADEAAFAGSGYSSSTAPYHANSFLRSGSGFWLLSPGGRGTSGGANGFALYGRGDLSYNYYMYETYGVRPAISLTPGTMAASGTGTAADPWIVNP